jgi:UDP-N-acetylmuramoyl-L-alanyl-D-glutamate--2,6-diaminopimelate ligase
MTSEGAKQFRHKHMNLDMLIFTNLSPEHIESHGSYENYVAAKLSIAEEMMKGSKKERVIIANEDDEKGRLFLKVPAEKTLGYSLDDVSNLRLLDSGIRFSWRGTDYISPQRGTFSVYNSLAALFAAEYLGVAPERMQKGLEGFVGARGRLEQVMAGQNFEVVVDYAHTADSLRQLYEAFPNKRKICVLGSTGGGRDAWKRPEMGRVADAYCDVIILTNEDPYDEDPAKIIHEVKEGIRSHAAHVVMDRREAIARALKRAEARDVVLISGKGTDPYIMEADGKRTPWSDSRVAREELEKLMGQS